jgi:acyl-CoA synthetase (AMP-forming)/AMP-acid ligase II
VSPDLPAKLLDRCRQALSRHQQPASVIVVGALPTGPTGKPDRRALRAAVQDLAPAAGPPRDSRIATQSAPSPS